MRLAKDHLDVGFSTTDWEAAERFWGHEVGLVYEEFLRIGGGVRQHRFGCHGSVVKVNHSREPLPPEPTVLRSLRLAVDGLGAPVVLHEPEGTPVELVPTGDGGVTGIEVVTAVADPQRARRFWVDGLGADDVGGGRFVVGDTLVRCVPEPGLVSMASRLGPGLRYLTVQVYDVDAEHARMLDLGFRAAQPPITLGDTARISFVCDDDGLFLEISQRASLTGPLPGSVTR